MKVRKRPFVLEDHRCSCGRIHRKGKRKCPRIVPKSDRYFINCLRAVLQLDPL